MLLRGKSDAEEGDEELRQRGTRVGMVRRSRVRRARGSRRRCDDPSAGERGQ